MITPEEVLELEKRDIALPQTAMAKLTGHHTTYVNATPVTFITYRIRRPLMATDAGHRVEERAAIYKGGEHCAVSIVVSSR